MNENIDLTKILKNCPKGTKFYSAIDGDVEFNSIDKDDCYFIDYRANFKIFYKDGRKYKDIGECVLFPSKDQRDWSKFVPTWEQKKPKVKVTIHPFDKVLGRCEEDTVIGDKWHADIFIQKQEEGDEDDGLYCLCFKYGKIIPYNKDIAHLLGTNDDCPIDYEIEFSKEYKE